MLNPSTADAKKNDRTIQRCIDFARRWGYGGFYVVNLYAWRATDPRELRKPPYENKIGPRNNSSIKDCVTACNLTVVAWGVPKNRLQQSRAELVSSWLKTPKALGLTKDGHPRHPLTLPKDSELFDFPGYSDTTKKQGKNI